MLNKIIGFSIKNKLIIGLMTVGLIIWGSYELTRLPIDAQPDITNNQVQIITVASSFSALDIERLVTFPVEQATTNIQGIVEMRSFSRFGLSLVTIVFDDKTDIYWARQQVSERLQKIQNDIPESIGKPELGPISSGLGEIYQYVVRPEKGFEKAYSITELRTLQDWAIRRHLLGVKGVADVSSFGGKLKQYEIAINSDQLYVANVSLQEVYTAITNNNQNTGGAYIEKGPAVIFIKSEGLINDIKDIENIVVKQSDLGVPILIKDLAKVHIGFATRYGALTYNDQGEVAGGIVMMLKGENSNNVIEQVKTKITEIQKSLPKGVVIEPFLDRTKLVNNTISTVKNNLMEGALIVVFILVVFLGNFRAGLIVASVIPLSLLFAITLMNEFGIAGNLMSLGALDFGLIVDGAVIIVEAVMHALAIRFKKSTVTQLTQREMDVEVRNSATKMVNSAVFGQIIILIVYLPILSLQGIEGKMFKPMALTVAFALIGAFILSLTYIPMMTSLFMSKKARIKSSFSDRMMVKVENVHQYFLLKIMRKQKITLFIVGLAFIFAIGILSRMGGEFIPSLEEGDFAVETRIMPGSSIETTIDYITKASKILKEQFPEVEKVVTKIGSGEIPTEPMPMDAGDMIIILKPKKEWTSARSFSELSEKMTSALSVIPGLNTGFQFPVQMRFNELMTGARQDVVCKIYGENLDSIANYATKLSGILASVKGAEDIYVEPIVGMPQLTIRYNRDQLARYGLDVTTINDAVNMAYAGKIAGTVYEGEKRFDLVVRLDTSQRKNSDNIHHLMITTNTGLQVPLSQLAEISMVKGVNQIQREEAKRRIIVGFNVRNRDVQSIVEEVQDKVQANIQFKTGYSIVYGGTFENLNDAKGRLMIAVPIALALIFLLLYFAFHSFHQSLIIYTAIPLSAIGGIYFLALRDLPFSISAGVGFIALFGVAVLNGIVLINEYNVLRKEGSLNIYRVVIEGTKNRLRPVLMTASVASLGFLPMAIGNGAGAEVQRPLATVVIGGLLFATILTLLVLPILYILMEKWALKKENKKLLLGIFIGCFSFTGIAQQTLSLDQAITAALENNLQVRQQNLLVQYHRKLEGASFQLPQTMIVGEYGNINTGMVDNKVGISQSFSFPTVYARQKNLAILQTQAIALEGKLTNWQIKKNLTALYTRYALLEEKSKLLTKMMSNYEQLKEIANLRMESGEVHKFEYNTSVLLYENAHSQHQLLLAEQEIIVLQIQLITQISEAIIPALERFQMQLNSGVFDSLVEHPLLLSEQQSIEMAKASLKTEQAKFLPDLSVGVANQTFLDINKSRYSSVQVGVGIPFFFKAQKSIVDASKTKVQLAENSYQYRHELLATKRAQLNAQRIIMDDLLKRYTFNQLKSAEELLEVVQLQLSEGEVNVIEWITIQSKAIEVQVNYYDLLQQYNEIINELNYLEIVEK